MAPPNPTTIELSKPVKTALRKQATSARAKDVEDANKKEEIFILNFLLICYENVSCEYDRLGG